MSKEKELFDLFSNYQSDYWELFYSRVLGGYFTIEKDGDTFEQYETFEELAEHILYEVLMDILFSPEYKRPRDNPGLTKEEIKAFYDKVEPYVEAMPELREIADNVISEQKEL